MRMAEIEAYSPLGSVGLFAMIDLAGLRTLTLACTKPNGETVDGAATPAQLRILRQGSSTQRDGGANLQL
jgi:hypothetical protein